MSPLGENEIQERLAGLEGWVRDENRIRRTYRFSDFRAAMGFVNRVAEIAEASDHHPDILVCYREVTLTLCTHEAGGLTDRDFRLARKIDT